MAEVSDFDIATAQRFLNGATPLTTTFFSGGRNANKVAVLQVSALGGARSGVAGLNIRVILNGQSLGQITVPRWTDHNFIIMHVVQIDFPSNRLLPTGPNVLRFEPVYASGSDYCWIGPAIVHFRQNT